MTNSGIPILFPIAFIAFWIMITTALGLVSGWYRLMAEYPDRTSDPILRLSGCTGIMGFGVGLSGILNLNVCSSGLRVRNHTDFRTIVSPLLRALGRYVSHAKQIHNLANGPAGFWPATGWDVDHSGTCCQHFGPRRCRALAGAWAISKGIPSRKTPALTHVMGWGVRDYRVVRLAGFVEWRTPCTGWSDLFRRHHLWRPCSARICETARLTLRRTQKQPELTGFKAAMLVRIDPTGQGGACAFTVATLNGTEPISLRSLLSHALVR